VATVIWGSHRETRKGIIMRSLLNGVVVVLSALFFPIHASAIYDPDDNKIISWDACGPNAPSGSVCTPENCLYQSPNALGRSVVRVVLYFPQVGATNNEHDTGTCSGLMIGERFIITAAHCFLLNVGYDVHYEGSCCGDTDCNDCHEADIYYTFPSIPDKEDAVRVQFYTDPTAHKHGRNGIAYFINDQMHIGTSGRHDSTGKLNDIINHRYSCENGGDDISIIVLNNSLSTGNPPFEGNCSNNTNCVIQCDQNTPCPAGKACTIYGYCSAFAEHVSSLLHKRDDNSWSNAFFFPSESDDCTSCDRNYFEYGFGKSFYKADYGQIGGDTLRGDRRGISDMKDEMFTFNHLDGNCPGADDYICPNGPTGQRIYAPWVVPFMEGDSGGLALPGIGGHLRYAG
jgi:hypothetical protein